MMKSCYFIIMFLLMQGYVQGQPEIAVYIYLAEKCPISIYMANPLQRVLQEHDTDVNYFAVFPMKNSTRSSARSFLEQNKLEEMAIILDPNQELALSHGATITPEVVVVQDGKIKYRGRISNAYNAPGKMKHGRRTNDLLRILNLVRREQDSSFEWLPAVGCFITFHHGL